MLKKGEQINLKKWVKITCGLGEKNELLIEEVNFGDEVDESTK